VHFNTMCHELQIVATAPDNKHPAVPRLDTSTMEKNVESQAGRLEYDLGVNRG